MRRSTQIVVLVLFVVVFTAPLIAYVAGARPSIDENREAAAFPTYDLRNAFDDGTYTQVAAAFTDRLPLRDRALRFYSRVKQDTTLTDKTAPGLPSGADGWLYLPEDLQQTCLGAPPPRFLKAGRATVQVTEAAGVPLFFVVAPDKVSVYPDHLPKEGLAGLLGLETPSVAGCTNQWRRALTRAAATDDPWLQVLADELQARAEQSDALLYFQQDTHWNDQGALTEVQRILDQVAPGMWNPAEVQPTTPDVKIGDLSRLVGRPQQEAAPGLAIVRPGVTVRGNLRGDVNDDTATVIRTTATSTDAPLVPGLTLFIADSFGRRSVELLAPYFEQLVVVSREQLIRRPIGSMLDSKPDRIVIEQVQRNVAKGWYDEGFEAARRAVKLPPAG